MPSLPKIARNVGLKIPRVHPTDASYRHFLNCLVNIAENKKQLPGLQKRDVDKQYGEALRQTFLKDEATVSSLLEQTTNAPGRKAWEEVVMVRMKVVMVRMKGRPPPSADLLQLKLPAVSQPHTGQTTSDQLKVASYRDFADTVRQRNPDIEFTKERIDDAFRNAAPRNSIKGLGRHKPAFDQMMSRCLGRESSSYWKGK
ncbi:hypothetical protein LTR08_002425 [Meristemomyces frigidus]|nr:hypothetical protein LTR08_002425 [Meristemomyces frigidus]